MRNARVWLWALAAAVLAVLGFVVVGYVGATSTPLVRHLTLRSPDYPSAAAPLTIAFFSDVHVHGPDMPPARLARIVAQVNGLNPDVVVLGGDFIGDNWVGATYSIRDAIAPLSGLKAKYGVYAVLGNND